MTRSGATGAGDHAKAALERRIEELETQLAFQEELQRRLDDVVARQDGEILKLKRQLEALAERVEAVGESAAASPSPADEVPPHY